MKRLLLIALTIGLATQPLSAQQPYLYPGVPSAQEYLQFIGGSNVGAFGVQVGPYLGHFQGDPASAQFSIYCVDFNHYAMSQWVNVTSLAGGTSLANTRLQNAGVYRQAAYLSSLFDTAPTSEWGQIHAAIWSLTSGLTGQNTGIYASLAVPQSFNTDNWYVLSPLNARGSAFDGTGQEFLLRSVSVPEPATFLLMATGLLLLAAFSRKRLSALTGEEL